jgi:hypothetical protein
MASKYICGDKYTISLISNTIALPVSLKNLSQEVEVDGIKFLLKPTFHISLFCTNEIIRKYKITIPNFIDSITKDFCEFVEVNDIKLINYKNEFRLAEQNDLKSIIVMCNVVNLDKFFEIVNKKYSLTIEYPPTHVTLYTLPDKLAIFLSDSADIEKLTKVIENPTGRKL